MKNIKKLSITAIFFFAISFGALAGEVKIIKENKGGFWGFNKIAETHEDGSSVLVVSGIGYDRAAFLYPPESLNTSAKNVNRFVRKVFKKIDKGADAGSFEKNGLKATWETTKSGSVEILIQK